MSVYRKDHRENWMVTHTAGTPRRVAHSTVTLLASASTPRANTEGRSVTLRAHTGGGAREGGHTRTHTRTHGHARAYTRTHKRAHPSMGASDWLNLGRKANEPATDADKGTLRLFSQVS